jgi:hypothetical protein
MGRGWQSSIRPRQMSLPPWLAGTSHSNRCLRSATFVPLLPTLPPVYATTC